MAPIWVTTPRNLRLTRKFLGRNELPKLARVGRPGVVFVWHSISYIALRMGRTLATISQPILQPRSIYLNPARRTFSASLLY
jgi:hypothetical protein